jgi:D-glycero-D-manno-heptose 1,7-bisphosphate phosphatase
VITPRVMAARAVFLDRDGVINRNVFNPGTGEYESPGKPEDFELHPEVLPALRALQRASFQLFLVSNQPNHAKSKSTLEELQAVHGLLVKALESTGVQFTSFYYCYHHPKGVVDGYSGPCECRKPSPYFLRKASREFAISLPDSWMVGDRATDVECGITAGVRTIRVDEDHPAQRSSVEPKADYEARDLGHAVTIILANSLLTGHEIQCAIKM